jgi:ferrochelatase
VRYAEAGDPYPEHCEQTAQGLARELGLEDHRWLLGFQSRFGREEWLKPYTDETLKAWGEAKLESVDVICPGFAADCLETLDEIDVENREVFEQAGGGRFRYIAALNDRDDHIAALAAIARRRLARSARENAY